MPYDNRPSTAHPQHMGQPMIVGEHHPKSFEELLDCVCSDLFGGNIWHGMVAAQMYKIGLRGFGRMHQYQAHHDFEKLYGAKNGTGGLLKILVDRLGYTPSIDTSEAVNTVRVSITGPADLKDHLHNWCESEKEFAKILTMAVRQAAGVDMCIYNELACILTCVQEEIMRLKLLKKRLEIGGMNGHDLMRISKDLHEHYENHAAMGMDVNLG